MERPAKVSGPGVFTISRGPEGKYLITSPSAGVVKFVETFDQLVAYLAEQFQVEIRYEVEVIDNSNRKENRIEV
jgi:L-2-hydroxyglutarate oxidase LhgO